MLEKKKKEKKKIWGRNRAPLAGANDTYTLAANHRTSTVAEVQWLVAENSLIKA